MVSTFLRTLSFDLENKLGIGYLYSSYMEGETG